MQKWFDEKLEEIYYEFKDMKNPPVPIETIREYLILEGFPLDDE